MRAQRSLVWLIFLSILSLGFSVLHNNGALHPVEDLIGRIAAPVQGLAADVSTSAARTLGDMRGFSELRADNAGLDTRVDQLTAELARLRATERENESLREAVGYTLEHPELEMAAAKVIGKDSSNLLDLLIIDRGRSSGLEEGMPVVWRGGLAGRIVSVAGGTARILPLTSSGSAVNVVLQGEFADADGVLTAQPDGTLLMSNILETDLVEPGQFVITSGLGGTFPRGILVGQIVNVRRLTSSVLKEADVRPFVRPDTLDTVQVIKAFEDG